MPGFSQLSVSSQDSRGTKRKWVPEEDVALVACMVDLHNVGTFNTDTGFNVSYLNELERMLEIFLPHAMLKAKPNLESIIRTLKRILQILMKKETISMDAKLMFLWMRWISQLYNHNHLETKQKTYEPLALK
ncbi:hypothetical protein Gotri_028077 [Gossypium trilobum]|uniref:Uncharacterized protein n=2 Tax=Gossypium TaxID=3633 RepID=A0A7J9FL96_9ROSI|nr:hypothetical protein [Gossypium trilobum]